MNKKTIRFSWDLHWSCNYRCPYCWWHAKWDEFSTRNVYPGTENILAVWKRLRDAYGEAHIEIAGGEPSTYPDFEKLLDGLLALHTIGVMTNLSRDISPLLKRFSLEKKNRLKLGATFHPLFADREAFIKRVLALKQSGFSVGVLYLAYPPQVRSIPEHNKYFEEKGIHFSVSTFWGEYKGKQYPASYTPEEVSIIDPALERRHGEKFQTTPLVTRGKLCNAGHTYGIIHPDGEFLRCGGGNWKGTNVIISNIFDEGFKLLDAPAPCPSENCPCNEWAFLLTEKNENAKP